LDALLKPVKWLIFTNLYIAIAAVCFQLIFCFWEFSSDWNWLLSLNTFFSTWLVYQLSRYSFHQNYIVTPEAQKDEIYQFVENHQTFLKTSILIAGVGTLVTLFFLNTDTLLVMGVLGLISLLYPIKYRKFSLRTIPFIKIFLIAMVWSAMAIWLPVVELNLQMNWFEYIPFFLFNFLFIVFITIPFDKVDVPIDQMTGVKTIPTSLGNEKTNLLIAGLAGILIFFAFIFFPNRFCAALLTVLFVYLAFFSIKRINRIHKWQVMAIYDGSMILFSIIIYLFYGN
jgi:4-hydroxybenzoate polyprenyltransferase